MTDWVQRIDEIEHCAIRRARLATVPELSWEASPSLLVAQGACANWLVADGRAYWVRDSALVDPIPSVRGCAPNVNEIAAAEAFVREFQRWLVANGVSTRLVGLAEPEHRAPGQSWDDVVRNGMRAFRPPANGWFGPTVEDETDSPQRAVVEAFQARQH